MDEDRYLSNMRMSRRCVSRSRGAPLFLTLLEDDAPREEEDDDELVVVVLGVLPCSFMLVKVASGFQL